jgi:uncharacterized low-complexity protein
MMIKKLLIAGALSGGLVLSAAGAAVASTSHVSTARTVAVHHVKAAESSGEGSGENSGEQEGSTPGDGPGGHADQPGQNVNHQAQGTE